MEIRTLESSDRPEVESWSKAGFNWDLWVGNSKGYVAVDGNEIAAAGFLIETTAGFVLMENLKVNPKLLKIKQARGIRMIVAHIEQVAISLGAKLLLGFTTESNTSVRGMHRKVFKASESSDTLRMVYKFI